MPYYKIVKSSRRGSTPYIGITCIHAKVKPGKIYDSLIEAEDAANKPTKHNPVGFVVEEATSDVLIWHGKAHGKPVGERS